MRFGTKKWQNQMSKGQCHKCRKVFGKIVQKNSEKCFEKLEKNTENPEKYCQKILEKGSENQQWMEWNNGENTFDQIIIKRLGRLLEENIFEKCWTFVELLIFKTLAKDKNKSYPQFFIISYY